MTMKDFLQAARNMHRDLLVMDPDNARFHYWTYYENGKEYTATGVEIDTDSIQLENLDNGMLYLGFMNKNYISPDTDERIGIELGLISPKSGRGLALVKHAIIFDGIGKEPVVRELDRRMIRKDEVIRLLSVSGYCDLDMMADEAFMNFMKKGALVYDR